MKTYKINKHEQYEGYLNVTELYNDINDDVTVSSVQIDINPNCIKWVKEISADEFDDESCPAVLLQVLQEHVNDDSLTIGTLTEFNDDPNIYLYLGV